MADFYIFNNGLMTENTMSGSDQRALHWSRIFSREHNISVFTSQPGAKRFLASGFKAYISGSIYLRSKIGLFLVYLSRAIRSCILQSKIKFGKEGIIYSSSDLLADVLPAVYMKLRNREFRLMVGMHLLAPNPLKGFKKLYSKGITIPSLANLYYFIFQRLAISVLKRCAELVLVSNNSDREFLTRKGFSPSRVMVTYGAFDAAAIEKAAAGRKLYDAAYVGRFHAQKGFPDLLEAWKIVAKELPKAQLIVIGEDISARDTENIKFLGYVGGEKKYSYLKSSRLLAFPSYYESFGIVALEAMVCGLPVVAYNLPLYEEIYPAGMLKADIGDVAGLARQILKLLSDEELREEVSRQAYALSRNFSWEKTAGDILKKLEVNN